MSFQAGWVCFDGRPVDRGDTEAILDSLAERAYARPAAWSGTGVFVAHAEFPTVEYPAVSAPPLATAFGAITFDGRLDNREDLGLVLRDALRGETSDAGLALAAYESRGGAGFANLIGDWSLAIWEASRKSVVLASDFAGVRPLYYAHSGGCIRWSTRLKPLIKLTDAREIDDEYIAGYLLHGACPNRTPFQGIFSVPPGHYLTASREGVEVRAFWQMPIGDVIRYQREFDYEERLRELFRDAVRSRLRTDTPVLAELSGGLDSSSVVCMATDLITTRSARAPQIITLTYDRPGSLDTRFYKAVEDWCGNESIHFSTSEYPYLTETQPGESFPAPWGDLHNAVASVARDRGARVLLSGTQGDLVMGNTWDDSLQALAQFRAGYIRAGLRETLAWSRALRLPMIWLLWRFFSASPPASSFMDRDQAAGDSIAPSFRRRLGLSEPHRFFSRYWMQASPERRDLFRGLAETLELRKLQPSEPLMHLACTHPYLHRPLLSFLLSVPPEIVCRAGERRRLMRRAFAPFWPPALRSRRSKDSFASVFYDALRPIAERLLRDASPMQIVERGYIDPQHLRARLEELVHSLECNQPQLRLIIALELWLRQVSSA